MKNEIIKVKHVKPIQKYLQKFYVQVITDARVKKLFLKYVLKRGPENLSDFANKFLKKKNVSEGILGKIVRGFLLNDQNLLSMAKVTCCGSLSDWLFSLEFKGYLEKFILSPDVMLQLLKKLKLYSKLGPDTVHKAPISFHIKTYL